MTPSDLFRALGDTLASIAGLRALAWSFIALYYAVSFLFIWAARRGKAVQLLARDGWLDKLTSAFWLLFALILIWSLVAHAASNQLTLATLVEFYVFFLFLFAFLYGLIEWHFPGKITTVTATEYEAEIQYLLVSIGAQTLAGYTRTTPSHWVTECIAALQSLLGLGFLAVWIATAVSRLGT
jgi:hypothetical protein